MFKLGREFKIGLLIIFLIVISITIVSILDLSVIQGFWTLVTKASQIINAFFTIEVGTVFDISVNVLQTSVQPGNSVSADLMVTNNGNWTEDLYIRWWIEDSSGNEYTSGSTVVNISTGSSWSSEKSLLVPSSASAGVYYFKINVTAGDYSAIAYDSFEVLGAGGGGVTGVGAGRPIYGGVPTSDIEVIYPENIIAPIGLITESKIIVKNTGETTLTAVEIILQGLELSWFEIVPEQTNIEFNESQEFTITLKIPSNANPKKYPIKFLVKGDEVEKTFYSTVSVIEVLGEREIDERKRELEAEINRLEQELEKLQERGKDISSIRNLILIARNKLELATNAKDSGNYRKASELIFEVGEIVDSISELIEEAKFSYIIKLYGFFPLGLLIAIVIIILMAIFGYLIWKRRKHYISLKSW